LTKGHWTTDGLRRESGYPARAAVHEGIRTDALDLPPNLPLFTGHHGTTLWRDGDVRAMSTDEFARSSAANVFNERSAR
jgi:hypothetical protein